MADTVNWPGKSGRMYAYEVYSINTDWKDVPGNYIFAKINGSSWKPVYIGQTDSFSNRLPNHEKRPCAERNGATHIHAHVNRDNQSRLNEEQDLINNWNPVCNG
jgi:hypothetical protein